MLPYFTQSGHFCVDKQTNKQTNPRMDRQSDYTTPCAQAHGVIITVVQACMSDRANNYGLHNMLFTVLLISELVLIPIECGACNNYQNSLLPVLLFVFAPY